METFLIATPVGDEDVIQETTVVFRLELPHPLLQQQMLNLEMYHSSSHPTWYTIAM